MISQVNQNISNSFTLSQPASEGSEDQSSLELQRNPQSDEKEEELKTNISIYSNLLEQQLFLDKHSPTDMIDPAPKCSLMMSNLTKSDQN